MRTGTGYACVNNGYYSYELSDRRKCDSLVLGGLFRAQHRARKEMLPTKSDGVLESARTLISFLLSMFNEVQSLNDNHINCTARKKFTDFEAKLRADERWKKNLRANHKVYMAAQRKKTGLSSSA
jgi:hypothetical protein